MFLLKILKLQTNKLSYHYNFEQYIKNLTNKIFILNEIKNKKYLRILMIKNLIYKNKLRKKFYYLKYFNNNFDLKFIKNALNFNFKFNFYSQKKKLNLVAYIININLTNTNTLINVIDLKGHSIINFSSGHVHLKKKQKIRQPIAIISILKLIIAKTEFLKNKPVAIYFKNINHHHESFIIKMIKSKFFIKNIKSYNLQPHNGCKQKIKI